MHFELLIIEQRRVDHNLIHHKVTAKCIPSFKQQEGNGSLDFRAIGQWVWLEIWIQQYFHVHIPSNSHFIGLLSHGYLEMTSKINCNLNFEFSDPVAKLLWPLYCWFHKILHEPILLLRTSILVRMSHWLPELRSEVKRRAGFSCSGRASRENRGHQAQVRDMLHNARDWILLQIWDPQHMVSVKSGK